MNTITPALIWSTHGEPRMEAAERLGLRRDDRLRRLARKMGFERPAHQTEYSAGPCVDCGVTWPVEELDADHVCPVCIEPDPMMERLEWEREESRRRMERPGRLQRIGRRRPMCRTVEW